MGERIVFSANGFRYPHWGRGTDLGSYLTPFTTNQLKTTIDLNVKVKTVKLPEEIMGGNLSDLEGRERLLRKDKKSI